MVLLQSSAITPICFVELPFLYYTDFSDVTPINTGWRLFHLLILFFIFSRGEGPWGMGIQCIKLTEERKINIFENGLNCVVTRVCPFVFSFLVCRLLSLHLPSSVCSPVIFRLFICRLCLFTIIFCPFICHLPSIHLSDLSIHPSSSVCSHLLFCVCLSVFYCLFICHLLFVHLP